MAKKKSAVKFLPQLTHYMVGLCHCSHWVTLTFLAKQVTHRSWNAKKVDLGVVNVLILGQVEGVLIVR